MDSKVLGLSGGGALLGGGSSSPWKLVVLFFVLVQLGLTAYWVVANDRGSRSPWLWPATGTREDAAVSLTLLRQELQAALSESERRLAGRGQEATKTDVTRLLRSESLDDEERKRLEEMQYCRRFPDGNRDMAPGDYLPPWVPHKDRFLLPLCCYGQISNRLVCMRNAVLLAALLNRTLLVPEAETGRRSQGGYPYRLVFDVPHARRCTGDDGNRTMMTVEEYLAASAEPGQKVLKVDRLLGFFDSKNVGAYEQLWGPNSSVQLPKTRESLPQGMGRVSSAAEWIQLAGGLQERVISPGDLFKLFFGTQSPRWADLPSSVYDRPNLPLRGLSCRMLIQPHPAIVMAAKGLVRSLLGPDFLAIHLRRGDFVARWNDESCHALGQANQACRVRSLPVLAGCIRDKLDGTNITVVFAATNAFPIELELLRSALAPVTLVTAPTAYKDQPFPWAQQWNSLQLDSQPMAFAAQDKLVCSMAKIFMGTVLSTFTTDIVAIRTALGTGSCEDQDLCAPFRYETDPLPFFNVTDPGRREYNFPLR